MPTKNNALYLTFDDGPHPHITKEVLAVLEEFKAKATFFCIGANVVKYPETYRMILQNGHATGNHTQTHLNGFNASTQEYLDNVSQCATLVKSNLFRPPYGRIKREQYNALKKQYKIVMWDVLPGDFDTSLSAEKCIKNALSNVKSGSMVVLHDSEKAYPRMIPTLKELLAWAKDNRMICSSLNDSKEF